MKLIMEKIHYDLYVLYLGRMLVINKNEEGKMNYYMDFLN